MSTLRGSIEGDYRIRPVLNRGLVGSPYVATFRRMTDDNMATLSDLDSRASLSGRGSLSSEGDGQRGSGG